MEMASSKITEGLARLDQKGWIHEEKSGYLIEAAKRYLELSGYLRAGVTKVSGRSGLMSRIRGSTHTSTPLPVA